MNSPNVAVGVAWFRPEQYSLLRAMSADADGMAKTYDEWLAGVTNTMEELRRQGMDVRKVEVDVTELVRWCEERGCAVEAKARAEYAARKLRAAGTSE